jgi:phosphate-selective porin
MNVAAALLLAVLAAPLPLRAQDDSVEARLRKLEAEVESLQKENAQLRRDLGLEVVARQSAIKKAGSAPIQLGGLIQAQTEGGDRGDSRFTDANARAFLRRARLNVSGRFVEEFSFRAELELAGSLSNATGLRTQLTDGYINWNRFDIANVRFGQFKTPFGFEQLYADPRLYTAERSMMSDRLTPGRQIGLQLAGTTVDERFTYAAGVFNGSGTNQNFNDNDKFMAAARIGAVPFINRVFGQVTKLSIGANAFRTTDTNLALPSDFGVDSTPTTPAKDNLFLGRRRAAGVDAQFELGPFELWSEYVRGTFEPTSRVPLGRFRSDGWYAQAAYTVIPDKLQLVERLEVFDPSDAAAGDATRSLVSGLNWYFKQHDLKLQVDWMRSRVPGVSKEQQKVIARLQTVF